MMQNWLLIGKKNMADRILIDTNVLLDYLLTREPFYEDAKKIIGEFDNESFLEDISDEVNGANYGIKVFGLN